METKNFSVDNIKKQSVIKLMVCFLCLIMAFGGLLFTNARSIKAETLPGDTQITYGTGLLQIPDYNLFQKLLNAYNPENLNYLTIDRLKDLTILDLSSNSASDKIIDLSGLNLLNLSSLETLILSNNNIYTTNNMFNFLTSLTTLDLSGNNLTAFDSSFSEILLNVNLSGNQIKTADISTIPSGATVNLFNNNLSDFSKITFPESDATVLLSHNMLTGSVPDDLLCILEMGFQGVKNEGRLVPDSQIKFYGLDGCTSISIFKIEMEGDVPVETLVGEYDAEEEIPPFAISAYRLVFNETNDPKLFSDIEFMVLPNLPTAEFWEGDTLLDGNITIFRKPTTVKLFADGVIYYSINGGEEIEGDEIEIDTYGTYTILVWQVQNGIESDRLVLPLSSAFVDPLSFVYLLGGAAALALLFYAGFIWKNNQSKPKERKHKRAGKFD